MRYLLLLLILVACKGYQLSPYVEYQIRDEDFGSTMYDGDTVMLGVSYKPPIIVEDYQFSRLEAAIRDKPVPANPQEEAVGYSKEIAAAGETFDLSDWIGASVVVLAIALLVLVLKPIIKMFRSPQ